MTDIVERLRDMVREREARGHGSALYINDNVTGWIAEAADEIERLTADYKAARLKIDHQGLEIEGLRNLCADLVDLVEEMPVKHPQQSTRRDILIGQFKMFVEGR